MNKSIAYTVGVIALLIGLYGFFDRLVYGEAHAAYGSFVVWGLWVAAYFFLGGIAVGCFLWGSLDLLFGLETFKGMGKTALWAALVTLVAGLMAIGFDLGHMERIWKAYIQVNFHSGVAEDVWAYTLFGIFTLIALYQSCSGSKPAKVILILGLIVALFVAGAPGKLMGVNAGRMYWHAGLLPVQFLIFALTTGAAMLMVIFGLFGASDKAARSFPVLTKATAGLLFVNLYMLWAYYSEGLTGNMPSVAEPIRMVMQEHAVLFWLVQVAVGLLIPLVVLSQSRTAANPALVGVMGLCVLLGNLVSRYFILVPAQQIDLLEGLSSAFHGRGYTLAYTPSMTEWAVFLGLIGIVILGLLIGADYLRPLCQCKSQKEA
jgi:molybdopterin-containing oxidoreductase family membrane subunit